VHFAGTSRSVITRQSRQSGSALKSVASPAGRSRHGLKSAYRRGLTFRRFKEAGRRNCAGANPCGDSTIAPGLLNGGGRTTAKRLRWEGRGAHPPARAFDVLGCRDHVPGSQLADAVSCSDLRHGVGLATRLPSDHIESKRPVLRRRLTAEPRNRPGTRLSLDTSPLSPRYAPPPSRAFGSPPGPQNRLQKRVS
jgi:hypothetical protein